MSGTSFVVVFLAFAISLGAPFLLRPILSRANVVDVPNERSSHFVAALRGMGLAPFLGYAGALAVGALWLFSESDVETVWVLFGAASAAALLGFAEDVRGVPIAARAFLQLVIGGVATYLLVAINESVVWVVPIGAFAFVVYTNAANFMDGINGISGLHGTAVGFVFASLGLVVDLEWLAFGGLVLAGSFVAFLPWNLARRPVFLGDVGSYLLGGSIAVTAVAAVLAGVPVLAVLAPLVIYIVDTGVTLFGRVVSGERWQDAHRKHVYQRLTDSGHSHVAVASIVTAFTLGESVLGLVSLYSSATWTVAIAFGMAILAVVYLAFPYLLELAMARRAKAAPVLPLPQSDLSRSMPDKSDLTWAVVGATGFVGSALAEELRSKGRLITIRAPRLLLHPQTSPDSVLAAADECGEQVQQLAQALRGVDVVVNAAGLASPDSLGGEKLFGANSLLPVVLLRAARLANVARFVHLSSAAVQGGRETLDETPATKAFSPYSRSKALGERAVLDTLARCAPGQTEVVILRATSVQGKGRPTTNQLQRLARSPLASVARPGQSPTVVSSLRGLTEFVFTVGSFSVSIPTIVLQPWEGMTTSSVLESAGGKLPKQLPALVCRIAIDVGYIIGAVFPPLIGLVRRVELMWFGQAQDAAWAKSLNLESNSYVGDVLSAHGNGPQ